MLSIAALILLGAGFATRAYHGVADVWTALSVCLLLFVTGTLDDRSFQSGANWGMMLFYGVLMSLGKVVTTLGVDRWLTGMTGNLLADTLNTPAAFVASVAVLAVASRFVLPWVTLASMLALVTMPLAISAGYSPLIPVLVLLIAADHTFFPFINEAYYTMVHASEGYMFSYKQARHPLWVEPFIRIAALTASVPVWMAMGLM